MKLYPIIVICVLMPLLCGAQDSIPEGVKTPEIKQVDIGQTFAKQLTRLLNQQKQIQDQLNFILAGVRDQAGIDSSYRFVGFSQAGQAVFTKPPDPKPKE